MTAWLNGIIGIVASFGIGMGVLALSPVDIVRSIIVSIIAGLVAVFVVLKGERTPWVKRTLMSRSLRTWAIFLTLYFGTLWLGAPIIREWPVFKWMIIPLILSTGFTILIFGPIQDRIVAARARRGVR